jgi:cyclopropane fatty-acyl-phospholipid synthase-like methyltransferase
MRYRKQKRTKKGGANFWDQEYKDGGAHLALSLDPSEDLEAFTRWLERRGGKSQLNVTCSVTDLGCGNGRNLIYLAAQYGMHGLSLIHI